jgi:putative nucleotidyltransferase with HDIG domain
VIKKIPTADLKLGMFVHDLNCGWLDHSFLRNSFMLRKEADLEKILQSGISEVYIDTIKGIDCLDAPTEAEVQDELAARIRGQAATARPPASRTTYAEELGFAKRILKEANQVIHSILVDVRLGRQIQVERVHPVVSQITESILRNQGTLVSLCRIREGDTYTFQHSVSVCALLATFCRAMGMNPETIHEAGMGGMLHDLGKMRVPDHILNKPGKLTEAEFAVMKDHVVLGAEVLRRTPGISRTVLQVAEEHHERYEGTGYPKRERGAEISQLGRMAAIVDVYDAITSNRIYHKGMEPSAALTRLFEWSDHHFDPDLVQRFIQAIGIYPVGSLVRLDSGRLAVVVEQGSQGLLAPVVRVVHDPRLGRQVRPHDLDLSNPSSGGDSITGKEDPEAWGINPYDHLMLESP